MGRPRKYFREGEHLKFKDEVVNKHLEFFNGVKEGTVSKVNRGNVGPDYYVKELSGPGYQRGG